MKQAVVVLTGLLLIVACVQSASVGVIGHVDKVKPVEGEMLVEDWASFENHRQKRRSGWRNFLCNLSCGKNGGYCKYKKGYKASISCRNHHVCVCDTATTQGGYTATTQGGYTATMQGGYTATTQGGYTATTQGGYTATTQGGYTATFT